MVVDGIQPESFILGWGDRSFVEAGLDEKMKKMSTMEMRSRDSSPIIVFASSEKKNLNKNAKICIPGGGTHGQWRWRLMVAMEIDGDGD